MWCTLVFAVLRNLNLLSLVGSTFRSPDATAAADAADAA